MPAGCDAENACGDGRWEPDGRCVHASGVDSGGRDETRQGSVVTCRDTTGDVDTGGRT